MRIFLVFMLFWASSRTSAQSYHKLLQPDRNWTVGTSLAYEQCFTEGLPPWSDCTTREQFCPGADTLIGGVQYRKYMRRSFSLSSSWAGPFILSAAEYAGALREDSLERKVYVYVPARQQEELLYDFSVTEGDTFHFCLFPFSSAPSLSGAVVDSVRFLPDGRKKLYLQDRQEMVEGIGSCTGLFHAPPCFEACQYLACVSDGGSALFDENNWPFSAPGNTGPYCSFEISSGTEPQPAPGLQLYPNPGNALFKIRGAPDGARLNIRDAQGRLLCTQSANGAFETANWPVGVYFLQIEGSAIPPMRWIKQ